MNTITLNSSTVRTLNVITNPNCQDKVRKEAIDSLSKELWGMFYNPKYFDLQKEEEEITLYTTGPEMVRTVVFPINNCEVTYKLYCLRNRLGYWYCDRKSLIIKTGRGILVL